MGYFPRCWKQLSFWDKAVWIVCRGLNFGIDYTDNGTKLHIGPNGNVRVGDLSHIHRRNWERRMRLERAEKESSAQVSSRRPG